MEPANAGSSTGSTATSCPVRNRLSLQAYQAIRVAVGHEQPLLCHYATEAGAVARERERREGPQAHGTTIVLSYNFSYTFLEH